MSSKVLCTHSVSYFIFYLHSFCVKSTFPSPRRVVASNHCISAGIIALWQNIGLAFFTLWASSVFTQVLICKEIYKTPIRISFDLYTCIFPTKTKDVSIKTEAIH